MSNPRRRYRRYYPRFRRFRRRGGFTIPLAPTIGLIAATNAYGAWSHIRSGSYESAMDAIMCGLTGYSTSDQSWDISRMKAGLGPILCGFIVHWVCGKLGVNRALGRARIPILRI